MLVLVRGMQQRNGILCAAVRCCCCIQKTHRPVDRPSSLRLLGSHKQRDAFGSISPLSIVSSQGYPWWVLCSPWKQVACDCTHPSSWSSPPSAQGKQYAVHSAWLIHRSSAEVPARQVTCSSRASETEGAYPWGSPDSWAGQTKTKRRFTEGARGKLEDIRQVEEGSCLGRAPPVRPNMSLTWKS
ncbi:hypothetical protein BCR34DRAFT_372115 [Clohesyomyces aquaticus]|uniref:Uncharacterized protein n=1 Tax=Clohesyomyces aquaticus TaxID=1231657 RepID=A0A1Y1ZGP2_9PLEO|nr:hypothetical protein BCR34DRAFT_372115 [Clohesyomyces aquaticus]